MNKYLVLSLLAVVTGCHHGWISKEETSEMTDAVQRRLIHIADPIPGLKILPEIVIENGTPIQGIETTVSIWSNDVYHYPHSGHTTVKIRFDEEPLVSTEAFQDPKYSARMMFVYPRGLLTQMLKHKQMKVEYERAFKDDMVATFPLEGLQPELIRLCGTVGCTTEKTTLGAVLADVR